MFTYGQQQTDDLNNVQKEACQSLILNIKEN